MKVNFYSKSDMDKLQSLVVKSLDKLLGTIGLGIAVERVEIGNGMSMSISLTIAAKNSEGRVVTPAEADYKRFAPHFKLPLDSFNKVFTYRGIAYRISGLTTSRPKYPVNAERVRDGKPFKFTSDIVRVALEFPHAA